MSADQDFDVLRTDDDERTRWLWQVKCLLAGRLQCSSEPAAFTVANSLVDVPTMSRLDVALHILDS